MAWKIVFYQSASGNRPVEDFIVEELDLKVQGRFEQMLSMLQNSGPTIGWPHIKYIGRGLWELRIRGKVQIRVIFVVQKETIILLHVFRKKSNKIPSKELVTSRRRCQDLFDN